MAEVGIKTVQRGKRMNNRELADGLCAVSSALSVTRLEHVRRFGTLIPHVFMADVLARVGWCLGQAKALRSELEGEVGAILGALEAGLAQGDRETCNVISLSFASDAEVAVFFERLRPMLGPRLLAALHPAA